MEEVGLENKDWKDFIGVKFISARVGPTVLVPGYEVRYANGHTSWSPQDTFDECHSELGKSYLSEDKYVKAQFDLGTSKYVNVVESSDDLPNHVVFSVQKHADSEGCDVGTILKYAKLVMESMTSDTEDLDHKLAMEGIDTAIEWQVRYKSSKK